MHFSMSFVCVMLFFLPVQGQYQRPTSNTPYSIPINCCIEVSQARVKETVTACFEQMADTFPNCVHAYIFVTKNQTYCVDPSASWLPERLEQLKKRGIYCEKDIS